MKFDPMTGQPIPEGNEQPKFDPATGKPVQQPQNGPSFDPMTGQPVNNTQNRPSFDPMTGQPVNQTPYQGQSFGNVPNTPQEPKKKTALYLGIGAVALVALLVILLVVKVAGMFGSPSTKIEKALINTFKESSVMDTSVLTESADDLQVDVEFSGKADGVNVDANINYAKTKKEMSLTGDIGVSVVSMDFNFYMNQSKVCFDMNGLSSPIYYDFTKEKDGDLEDLLDGAVTFDQIDTVLKTLADSDSLVSDIKKANSKALATLEFEKVDSEKFEVNGKDVKCSGYVTTLDKDAVEAILEEYKTALDNHEEIVELVEELSGTDLEDMIEQITDDITDEAEVDITFYLYKNQIAAIILEEKGGDEIEILFEGGSFPTQNMKVKSGKETVYEVKGEEEDGVITQEVYQYGEKTSKMEYDKNSGEISLTYSDDYSGSLTISGTYEKTKGGFTLEFDDIEYDTYSYYASDLEDFKLTIAVTKGANIEKVDTEDALDLGNADEDELMEFAEDVASLFGGF